MNEVVGARASVQGNIIKAKKKKKCAEETIGLLFFHFAFYPMPQEELKNQIVYWLTRREIGLLLSPSLSK